MAALARSASALFGASRGGSLRQLRRSCDRWPERQSEMAFGEIFLRCGRLGAVRGDHAASRILPDAHRAEDPGAPCAATMAGYIPLAAALVEFGTGSTKKARILIDAAPQIAAYVPVDISAEFLDAGGGRRAARHAVASRCCRSRPTSRATSICRRRSARARASDSSPARPSAISSRRTRRSSCVRPARILGSGATMIVGVDRIKDDGGAQRRL